MSRLALWMVASLCLCALGCATKPSEEECRQAITNMTRLMGTENLRDNEMIESQVRRCKGGSSKKSVECAIKAQTLDELRACEFYKVPENAKGVGQTEPAPAPGGAAAGSAAVDSAAAGSAAAGSAAAGSAATDAPAPAEPAGSAGTGSAVPTP